MQKLMTLRFAGKCKRCGNVIGAGERAYYLGRGKGIQHPACSDPKPVEIGKPADTDYAGITFDFSEVVSAFKVFQDHPEKVYLHAKNHRAGESLSSGWEKKRFGGRDPWAGCSIEEMNSWIENGYRVEGLSAVQSLIPTKPKRKLRRGEEGDELLIDLAWSGDDMPFIEWEKRQSKPGLSVEIDMTFSCIVDARLIAEYQTWIARALSTLDENGVAMDVNLVVRTTNADMDRRDGKPLDAKIRVAKAGEATGFASWSAMFSPGGFRMLGIMSTGMMVDRMGGSVSYGYGSPQPLGRWDVLYDDERNVLKIGADRNGPFPTFEMTEKLVTVLSKLTGR